MAKKIFTDESLATFVDEIKSYTDDAVSTKSDIHNHPYLSNTTTYAGSSSVGGAANSANKVNITRPSKSILEVAGDMAIFTESIYFFGSDGLTYGAPVNYVIINAKKGANHRTILDCYALNTGDHYINGCMNAQTGSTASDANVWTGWILQPNQASLDTTLQSAKSYTDTVASGKADKTHNHDASDIKADLPLNNTSGKTVEGILIDLDDALTNKANVNHNHDSKYDAKGSASGALAEAKEYTDTVASGKANSSHTHSISNVTNLQSSLDAKVPTSRTINNKNLSANITLSASDIGADASGSAADALSSAKSYTDTKTSGLASTSSVTSSISTHNTSTSAHNDIRDLITGLTNRLNALADSDDTTLDQMSEIVAYIKANKDLIDSITTSKVNVSDIVNNLTTNVTNKPLSAAQGVAIKALIDELQSTVNGKASSSDLTSHTSDSTIHITSVERTKWNATTQVQMITWEADD